MQDFWRNAYFIIYIMFFNTLIFRVKMHIYVVYIIFVLPILELRKKTFFEYNISKHCFMFLMYNARLFPFSLFSNAQFSMIAKK